MRTDETRAEPADPSILRVPLDKPDGSDAVWQPLRDTWLAWSVAQRSELHHKGAHSFKAEAYEPVLLVDAQDGRMALAFEQQSTQQHSTMETAPNTEVPASA